VAGKDGTQMHDVGPVDDMYRRLIDDFLEAVADRGEPRTPGEEGLAVLRIVEAAAESSRRGSVVETGAEWRGSR